MAHIELRSEKGRWPNQLIINGVDYSMETYCDVELVEVGDTPEVSEVGFRVTFVVSRLDLDADADVVLTDHVPAVATRVRRMVESD